MTPALTIRMKGDWHIGTGAGSSSVVDRAVRRDVRDGLPYLPGKTLVGLWRDGCETFVASRTETQEVWQSWLNYLLGDQPSQRESNAPIRTPVQGALRVGDARLPLPIRQRLIAHTELAEGLFVIKPGIKLDADGQVVHKHLRFIEFTRGGVALTLDHLQLPELDDAQQAAAVALLWYGAAFVEAAGGHRRRGAGECQWQLRIDEKLRKTASELLNATTPPDPPPPCSAVSHYVATGANCTTEASKPRNALKLKLELQAPVLLPTATLGNVTSSEDYVPARYLVPHVLATLARELPHVPTVQWHRWLAQGALVVSHAYPMTESGQRALPMPFAMHYDKLHGGLGTASGRVYNRLWDVAADLQIKQHRSGFLVADGDGAGALLLPGMREVTHNVTDDVRQRPTKELGGVYSYQALEPGQQFAATVKLPETLQDAVDAAWFDAILHVGQSRVAEYGRVRMLAEPAKTESAGKRQQGETDGVAVWLASDVLLRGADNRPSVARELLMEAIGRYVPNATLREEPDSLIHFAFRTGRSDGWRPAWGLPRPSYLAIQAGSCLVLDGKVHAAELAALEAHGVGERRGEGYGEIVCGAAVLQRRWNGESGPGRGSCVFQEHGHESAPLDEHSKVLLTQLVQQACERTIRRYALERLTDSSYRKSFFHWSPDTPTMNQLGRLRAFAMDGSPDDSIWCQRLLNWAQLAVERNNLTQKAADTVRRFAANDQGRTVLDSLTHSDGTSLLDTMKATIDGAGMTLDDVLPNAWRSWVRILLLAALQAHARQTRGGH